jgi:3-isopropylmalate dehydrogenase
MTARIVLLPGDGIGPEVVAQAAKTLDAVGERFGRTFRFVEAPIGGAALDEFGDPLPDETVQACLAADGILLGAVGGPKWDDPRAAVRPEQGLLRIRQALHVFANLRPVRLHPRLVDASPLRADRLAGVDLVIVRELTGGIYFGDKVEATDEFPEATDTMRYSEHEVRRIAHVAFALAQDRRRHVTSVDKANVLACSRLWRRVVQEVASEYPEVRLDSMLVDAAAMNLIRAPSEFDVLLTENMFGDILADEAAMLCGSIGMLPSASVGEKSLGLYEPVHGSAPDLVGRDAANPIAAILSAAMLMRHSLGWHEEAVAVEEAVDRVLSQGYATADIAGERARPVGTSEMGDLIREAVRLPVRHSENEGSFDA